MVDGGIEEFLLSVQLRLNLNNHILFQHWLDPTKRVSQQIKGISPITLYLGVKFYSADPCKLVEEITRYQFFLQVKLDILQGRLPVPQELSTELAALALQCKYLIDLDFSSFGTFKRKEKLCHTLNAFLSILKKHG